MRTCSHQETKYAKDLKACLKPPWYQRVEAIMRRTTKQRLPEIDKPEIKYPQSEKARRNKIDDLYTEIARQDTCPTCFQVARLQALGAPFEGSVLCQRSLDKRSTRTLTFHEDTRCIGCPTRAGHHLRRKKLFQDILK